MTTTFTLSDGTKIKSASRCRFIVVARYAGKAPFFAKRSDSLATARKAAAKLGKTYASEEVDAMAKATRDRFEAGELATAEYVETMAALDAHKVPVAVVFDALSGEVV
jgi:hypothetical protein